MSQQYDPSDYELFGLTPPSGNSAEAQPQVDTSTPDASDYELFGLTPPQEGTQEALQTVVEETQGQPMDSAVEAPVAAPVAPVDVAGYRPSINTSWEGYRANGAVDFGHPKWEGLSEEQIVERVRLDKAFQADEDNAREYEIKQDALNAVRGTGKYAPTEYDRQNLFFNRVMEENSPSILDTAKDYLSNTFDLGQNERMREESKRKLENKEFEEPSPIISDETSSALMSLIPKAPVSPSSAEKDEMAANAFRAMSNPRGNLTKAQEAGLDTMANAVKNMENERSSETAQDRSIIAQKDLEDLAQRAQRLMDKNPEMGAEEAINKARTESNIDAAIDTGVIAASLATAGVGGTLGMGARMLIQGGLSSLFGGTGQVAKNVNRGDETLKDVSNTMAYDFFLGSAPEAIPVVAKESIRKAKGLWESLMEAEGKAAAKSGNILKENEALVKEMKKFDPENPTPLSGEAENALKRIDTEMPEGYEQGFKNNQEAFISFAEDQSKNELMKSLNRYYNSDDTLGMMETIASGKSGMAGVNLSEASDTLNEAVGRGGIKKAISKVGDLAERTSFIASYLRESATNKTAAKFTDDVVKSIDELVKYEQKTRKAGMPSFEGIDEASSITRRLYKGHMEGKLTDAELEEGLGLVDQKLYSSASPLEASDFKTSMANEALLEEVKKFALKGSKITDADIAKLDKVIGTEYVEVSPAVAAAAKDIKDNLVRVKAVNKIVKTKTTSEKMVEGIASAAMLAVNTTVNSIPALVQSGAIGLKGVSELADKKAIASGVKLGKHFDSIRRAAKLKGMTKTQVDKMVADLEEYALNEAYKEAQILGTTGRAIAREGVKGLKDVMEEEGFKFPTIININQEDVDQWKNKR
ncbi:MAG: hypothetical protein ACRDCE_18035 [Cetobacterium sp.]|uniref:hypothetical protein n=1 Tax=Cetobacterium sp. TaxID=2071632 RepID=UPI003EE45253